MAIAYNTQTSTGTGTSGNSSASISLTATSGADVFVAISTAGSTARTVTAITYGGTAMTLVANIGHNNITTYGMTVLYRLAASGSGAAKTVSFTLSQSTAYSATAFSYTGVGSVGTATTSTGQSTSPSIGPTSCSSGDVILGVIGTGTINTNSGITATSGGTNRAATNSVSNYAALAVSDSTTSGTTFSTTQSASVGWSGIALVLSPSSSDTTLTPSGATVTVTGTAPSLVTETVLTPAAASTTVTGTAPNLNVSLVMTGAAITITGGTPSAAGEAILTPAAATVTVTTTSPTLSVLTSPGSQTLPVTGGTPSLGAVVAPAGTSVTVTTGTPVLVTLTTVTSAAASVTVAGLAPLLSIELKPSGASIVVTGRTPVLGSTLIPDSGSITITGSAPIVPRTLLITPAAAPIEITLFAPQVLNITPPRPMPTSVLTPTAFREIEQQLHDRRHAYQSRKVPQPLIRLWDKEMQLIARIVIPETWECEEIAHDNGMARIEIVGKDNDWLREILMFKTRPAEDLHITIDPDPAKPTDWKNRWGGKVETLVDEERQGKPTVTTITAVSNRIHLRHILMAAMPVLPHAVQIPKMFLWGGPCVTACASAVFVNLFRIYTLNGWWPLPRNLFAPETWLENLSPLNWPVQVMPVNPLLDQSRWITIGARWQDAETVLKPAMKDAGVVCHAYTWLPGDPAPYEVFGPLKAQLKPTRACTILSFEDQSGVGGPTGTAIDGLVNLFAVTLDDLFTETLVAVDGDGDGQTDPFIRKLLGVAPKRPPFVYRDTGYGGVLGRTTVVHKSKAISIVVGGRSPGWVNSAIAFGIRYGLSQIATAISNIPGAPAQLTGSEGLDNLYQGQLDDTLLAFMPFVDPRRSAAVGPYARNEHFEQGSGFTISSIMQARQGWWATRPYTSMKFDIDDTLYRIGEDIALGSRVSAERKGIVYTDQIMAIKRTGDRNSSGRPVISFGDDSREEDPVAQGFAAIANVANFAAMLAGSGTL